MEEQEEKVCDVCGCSLPEGQCTTILKMQPDDEEAAKLLIEQGEILETPVGAYFRLLNAPIIREATEQAEREKALQEATWGKYKSTVYKQQALPEGYVKTEIEGRGSEENKQGYTGTKVDKWLDFLIYMSMIMMRKDFPHTSRSMIIPKDYAKFTRGNYNSFLTTFVNELKDEEHVDKQTHVEVEVDSLKITVDRKPRASEKFRRAAKFSFHYSPATKHLLIDWYVYILEDSKGEWTKSWRFTLM